MKYLVDLGISKDIVDLLDDATCYNMKINEKKITEIILYLKNIGINNLDELIINELRILYMDFEDIRSAFNNCNQKEMVELINNDIVAIEDIL
ncbi:MAG: hypothetical protein IJA94_06230 [Bacilli bacterium]|nr:hypothetical protein [Bacilli bacterium]